MVLRRAEATEPILERLEGDRLEISNPGQPDIQFDRFIDGYQCRNEPMADLMRRLGLCEEKGSGIDKVIRAVEEDHLPALEYRVDSVRTSCILRGPRPFSEMNRGDRIRACYQHCCLPYVSGELMTKDLFIYELDCARPSGPRDRTRVDRGRRPDGLSARVWHFKRLRRTI